MRHIHRRRYACTPRSLVARLLLAGLLLAGAEPAAAQQEPRPPGLDPADAPGPPLPIDITLDPTQLEARWKAQIEYDRGAFAVGSVVHFRLPNCYEQAGVYRWRAELDGQGTDPAPQGRVEGCVFSIRQQAPGPHRLTVTTVWHEPGGRRSSEVSSDPFLWQVPEVPEVPDPGWSPLRKQLTGVAAGALAGLLIDYFDPDDRDSASNDAGLPNGSWTAIGAGLGFAFTLEW